MSKMRYRGFSSEEQRSTYLLDQYARTGRNTGIRFLTDAETVLSACAVEVSNTLIDGPPALYNDYDRLKREKVEMFYEKINRKLAKGEDTQFTLHRRAMSPSKREPFPKVESVTVYDIIGMAVNAASEMGVDVSSAIENMKKQKLLETLE